MRPEGDIRLYERLPAHIRTRDADMGRPLEALCAILQDEFELVEADIAGLYENWFIETAAEWVVPYIADLLGVRNLRPIESAGFSMRAYVANTLAYRQAKGTPGVLEQLAGDVTGWEARITEFFQTLVVSQHLNHIRLADRRRLHNSGTTDIRSASRMQLNDTAFDACAHTAEVRRIATRLGRHNIPNVGLWLWRLQHYFLQRMAARAVVPPVSPRCFHLGPLNHDFPLFNRPKDQLDIRHIATERNVPTTIRRLAMRERLAEYLDPAEPVVECWFDGVRLTPDQITVCHLEWTDIAAILAADNGSALVAIDPERGRLLVLSTDMPELVEVSSAYGFSGDVGGGPYDRNDGTVENIRERTWQKQVQQNGVANFTTIQDALDEWNLQPTGTKGVIAVVDNATYAEDLTVELPPGSDLLIVAARPFKGLDDDLLADLFPELDLAGRRPHLLGNIIITGAAGAGSSCTLNGFLVEGELLVDDGDLGALNVQHCTIMPSHTLAPVLPANVPLSSLQVDVNNATLEIAVNKSIIGAIALEGPVECLTITDSIIDGDRMHLGADAAITPISAPDTVSTVDRTTVLGPDDAFDLPSMRTLHASESIFTGRVVVERKQEGCVRYCYLPFDSVVPRRFRCQPDLELDGVTDVALRTAIAARMRPQFNATAYGEPDYAQLDRRTDPGIRLGAEDGSEMGAFCFLKQPHREENLLAVIPEYLPFGLQAGLFFINEADAFRPSGPSII